MMLHRDISNGCVFHLPPRSISRRGPSWQTINYVSKTLSLDLEPSRRAGMRRWRSVSSPSPKAHFSQCRRMRSSSRCRSPGRRRWTYALICTVGSVAGALLGYAIGAFLRDSRQMADQSLRLWRPGRGNARALRSWGWAVILLKGFTPIPFKIVTITSGLLTYSLPLFVFAFLTRGARFFFSRCF